MSTSKRNYPKNTMSHSEYYQTPTLFIEAVDTFIKSTQAFAAKVRNQELSPQLAIGSNAIRTYVTNAKEFEKFQQFSKDKNSPKIQYALAIAALTKAPGLLQPSSAPDINFKDLTITAIGTHDATNPSEFWNRYSALSNENKAKFNEHLLGILEIQEKSLQLLKANIKSPSILKEYAHSLDFSIRLMTMKEGGSTPQQINLGLAQKITKRNKDIEHKKQKSFSATVTRQLKNIKKISNSPAKALKHLWLNLTETHSNQPEKQQTEQTTNQLINILPGLENLLHELKGLEKQPENIQASWLSDGIGNLLATSNKPDANQPGNNKEEVADRLIRLENTFDELIKQKQSHGDHKLAQILDRLKSVVAITAKSMQEANQDLGIQSSPAKHTQKNSSTPENKTKPTFVSYLDSALEERQAANRPVAREQHIKTIYKGPSFSFFSAQKGTPTPLSYQKIAEEGTQAMDNAPRTSFSS
ncbi:hypothetical protein [Rickettsiella endosymbiont of Dermanyssus gallinae]|uniref:hypothetical protein n=1 Tax=Rickettsiella endosymbiont of Dermanyssus gallinae TaxID=2856608 RepID=UPI001C532DEF|nr:hypothetical protein [Rickettsiella endosymbiont of Dermanyssus gallinae]